MAGLGSPFCPLNPAPQKCLCGSLSQQMRHRNFSFLEPQKWGLGVRGNKFSPEKAYELFLPLINPLSEALPKLPCRMSSTCVERPPPPVPSQTRLGRPLQGKGCGLRAGSSSCNPHDVGSRTWTQEPRFRGLLVLRFHQRASTAQVRQRECPFQSS